MVAPRKIRCAVVAVIAETDVMPFDNSNNSPQPRFRPSDLVPWADPQISQLVRKLQTEVRNERERSATQPTESDLDMLRADLDLPWNDGGFEFETPEEPDSFDSEDWRSYPSNAK